MITTSFDDSLPALVRALRNHFDGDFANAGVAVRDASGRLTFVARSDESPGARETFEQALRDSLGAYARDDRPIIFADEPGAEVVLNSALRIPIEVESGVFCSVLDRRIVGAGWLEVPNGVCKILPVRIVFATLKGGVGRSTALAVAAADLSRRNKNVLVVDLDLEAPGLGSMMFDSDQVPEFGAIDYLVENGIGGVSNEQLASFVGSSNLTTGGGGRVDVVPALGRKSSRHQENVLSKLSRAMIEDVSSEGVISVGSQISSMIERIASRSAYDVVLIDSRAGLAELAAPAVIGLGAHVLLFGTSQKQTFEGYRALFASLKLLAQRALNRGEDAEWRALLKPVYAKASMDASQAERFLDEMFDLFSENIYDAEVESSLVESPDAFRYLRDDSTAPHFPLTIAFSQLLLDFDPVRTPSQLTASYYDQAFRPFIDCLDSLIESSSAHPRAPT